MDRLRDRLESIHVENYESKWYIPKTELDSLLNSETVREAVSKCGIEPYRWEEVIRAVLLGGRKVFATLVRMRKEAAILSFIENDQLQGQLLDAKLPFNESHLISILGKAHGEVFYRMQWAVSPPLFRGDLSHRNFNKATILPFIRNKKIGCGAFGTVFEVSLDPRHQENPLSSQLPAVL